MFKCFFAFLFVQDVLGELGVLAVK